MPADKKMPLNKKILIVCRRVDELRLLSRVKIEPENKYFIASDDPRVHRAVEKYSWVNKICFIEQIEPFYKVTEDVIKFLEIINKWLESLADNKHGFRKELLFWIRHAEGGITTQRIQDLLLLIRSYRYLIDNYNINQIFILCHPGTYWEDSVLSQTARSRGTDVQFIGNYNFNILFRKLLDSLKVIAIELYNILFIIRVKFTNLLRFSKLKSYKKEIVLQLCSSAPKHVIHYIPLAKAIEKKGYTSVVLCWGAHRGAKSIRKEKLIAEELENWVPISTIFLSIKKNFKSWKNAVARRKDLLLNSVLQYQSVPIAKLLWPSVKFFFMAELAQRYRLMIASKKYFERHSPLAIKFWTLIFPEAVIPFIYSKKRRPFVFHWAGPIGGENPYEHQIIPADVVFAANQQNRKMLVKYGFSPEKIISVGQVYRDNIDNFRKKYNRNQSCSYLKIPMSYSVYILYDPGYILRGYLASSEQVCTTEFLLDFASKHPFAALLIKPHPAHKHNILECQIKSYFLNNVFLIDHKMLPFHAINAVDFVITKFSSIGLEAMHFNRSVISFILDGEKRFKLFGDSAEYIYSIQELNNFLSKIVNDEQYRNNWSSILKKKAKVLLNEQNIKTSKSAYEIVADTVDVFLKQQLIH